MLPKSTFCHSITPSFVQRRYASLIPRVAISAIKESLEKPKKPLNGYGLFHAENFANLKSQMPNSSLPEISRKMGSLWKSLSEVEKKAINDRADKLGEIGRAEMVNYMENLTEHQRLAHQTLRYQRMYSQGKIMRAEVPKEVKKFIKQLPSSPTPNGRAIFMARRLTGVKDLLSKVKDVSAEWNSMDATEKQSYENEAQTAVEQFKKNLRELLKSGPK